MKRIFYFIFILVISWALISCEKSPDTQAQKLEKKASKSDNNGISIVDGYGYQDSAIYMTIGQSMQLHCIPLIDDTIGVYPQLNWYTNDQGVVYAYWLGMIQARGEGVTVISAFQYRRNPNYNGHNNQWLNPYQDRVIVYVTQ